MTSEVAFEAINESKVDLNHIYNQTDPRGFYTELEKLDYAIPDVAKPIFQTLITQIQHARSNPIHVLDLGCSYGVNAALLKHDISMSELYDHWRKRALATASLDKLVSYDQMYLRTQGRHEDIEVTGIDQAENAIRFATRVGLLDHGLAINLEEEELPESLAATLASVDLVISTGCVGYMTEKSFERILPAVTQGEAPWIANFVLRSFPFDTIDDTLSSYGYVTEKLQGQTFFQRTFASVDEQEQMIEQLVARGIDPAGKEAKGQLLAELYLSRPKAVAAELPLQKLLSRK